MLIQVHILYWLGNHNIKIKDDNGCVLNMPTFAISEPTPFTSNYLVNDDASCLGVNDAEIILSVSGGSTPYTYSAGGGGTFSGLTTISGPFWRQS